MKSITVEIKARFDQLTAGFKGASDSVRRSLDDMGQRIEESNKRFGAMSKTLESAGGVSRTFGIGLTASVTAAIVGLGIGAVTSAAQIETLQTAFVPLLGSATAARDRISELQQFANATPFELPEVAQASRVLQVLTKGALATGDALRLVGDVASGTNQPFQDVAMWVGRLYSGLQAGAPVGEATMRLMEMGAMSTETKMKLEELQKAGLKGNEIWQIAAKDFAQFAGGMALQADTMAGKWSTLQDSARTALASIGAAIAPVAKTLMDFLIKASDAIGVLAGWFQKMPGFVQGTILVFAGLAAAVGPLLLAFGALAGALTSVIAAWPRITAGAAKFGAALVPLLPALAAVGAAVGAVVLAVDVLKNGWTATGREEIRQAREAARIEEETVGKVAAIRKRAADERAAAAAAETAKKKAEEAKAAEEREKIAKENAKRIAQFREDREQEVIDYANAKEQERANREMSLRQRLADAQWKRKIEDERRADEADEAKRQKRIADQTLEYERGLEQTRNRLAEQDRLEEEAAQKQRERAASIEAAMNPALSSLSNGLTGLILKTGTIKQMFLNIRDVIVGQLVSAVVMFFGRMIAQQIAAAATGKAIAAANTAALVPIAAAQSAIWAGPATLSTIASVGASAAAAPLQIATASAATRAMSFAVGTPYVPNDMLAQIHKGEMIVPATFADGLRRGDVSLGGGGAAPSARGTLVDLDASVMGALRRNGRALVEINADNVRGFALGGV